jgi:hypothetical protein
MSPLASLLAVLAVSPILVFIAHAIAYRALDRTGAKPTAHSSAMLALIGAFIPVGVATWRLGFFDPGQGAAAALCAVVYVMAVYGALGILYLDVVNIAETSLHMHLLLELAWGGAVPLADLLERYSADRMIAARLERLTSLGQLRIVDGRCHVANRSTLYLAGAIDAWRTVLGLPTSPPGVPAEPSALDRGRQR